NHTPHPDIYPLSLHDALPISQARRIVDEASTKAQQIISETREQAERIRQEATARAQQQREEMLSGAKSKAEAEALQSDKETEQIDRKSTRLNSSHLVISYAVF